VIEANRSALTVTLPSDREIHMTRVFDAPRRLVFDACTKPEHVVHWFGPRGHTMPICEIDLREGGAYRFVGRAADGSEHPFKGVYREIDAPGRIVYTWIYDVEPWLDHEAVVTVTLDEKDGRTTMTIVTLMQSAEARDGLLSSGMESGAGESYDRLAERLTTMA
jgi:uncharacterized protein YndB with AHSA1/START domain